MEQSTIWWLLAGTAIGVELVTGTFYLLMIAFGMAAAAIAAHMNATLTVQVTLAAAVGAGSVLVWRRYQKAVPSGAPANANPDVNLDIGETVQVDSWNADGTANVKYRGANWAVSNAAAAPYVAGPHRVVEVVGSRLVVRKL